MKLRFHTHQWWSGDRFLRPIVDAEGRSIGATAFHTRGEVVSEADYQRILDYIQDHGIDAALAEYPQRLYPYAQRTF